MDNNYSEDEMEYDFDDYSEEVSDEGADAAVVVLVVVGLVGIAGCLYIRNKYKTLMRYGTAIMEEKAKAESEHIIEGEIVG